MKKVLFATSALVASAGFAAADVSLSGSAEMGIRGGSGQETRFHTHADVAFALSGSTDNGLTFGVTGLALSDADNVNPDAGTDSGMAVFMSGNFGTLTMGDTDGGFDWAMSEVPTGSGSIADDESGHTGFSGNSGLDGLYDNQVLRYNHGIGDLSFAVSMELDDTGTADPVVGLGLRYSLGDTAIGLGYQSVDLVGILDITATGLSVTHSAGALTIGANVSNINFSTAIGDLDIDHVGIGMSYTMDAITIGVNAGQTEVSAGGVSLTNSGWGLSAGYDLGGGASIVLGYGSSDNEFVGVSLADWSNSSAAPSAAASTANTWSLGVSMSF